MRAVAAPTLTARQFDADAHNTVLSGSVSAGDTDGGASGAPTKAPVGAAFGVRIRVVPSGAYLLPGTNRLATSIIRSRSMDGTRPGTRSASRSLDGTRCGLIEPASW